MLAVVIPARNEAARMQPVLRTALRLPADLVIPVLNGCTDMSAEIVRRVGDKRIRPLHFKEPLGFDVPRIAGAQAALDAGARWVIFLDADLTGPLESRLAILAEQVKRGRGDLLLSDCYAGTPIPFRDSAAKQVYDARIALNEALGRPDLGAAIPSHGPVAVTRRLLETVPTATIGVPPLMQANAVVSGLRVDMGVCIPHKDLGSAQRDKQHRLQIAQTIIGDCLQAMCLAQRRPPDREGHLGYHPQRRFDLLGLRPPEGLPAAPTEENG